MKKTFLAKVASLNERFQTASVYVELIKIYKKYDKRIVLKRYFLVHYDKSLIDGKDVKKNSYVKITESLPISKRKRFVISSLLS